MVLPGFLRNSVLGLFQAQRASGFSPHACSVTVERHLAHQLIASLDQTVKPDAETERDAIIDRRSREIEVGKVSCRQAKRACFAAEW
jgi:hypothetical protein